MIREQEYSTVKAIFFLLFSGTSIHLRSYSCLHLPLGHPKSSLTSVSFALFTNLLWVPLRLIRAAPGGIVVKRSTGTWVTSQGYITEDSGFLPSGSLQLSLVPQQSSLNPSWTWYWKAAVSVLYRSMKAIAEVVSLWGSSSSAISLLFLLMFPGTQSEQYG